jgi:hypothetical protein
MAGAVMIETRKPFGPAPGRFCISGALAESGSFSNSSLILDGQSSPRSVTVHVTQRFAGALGTFTLRAEITQTATADPGVLAEDGTWAIIDGAGAYATLRGHGGVTGTADDNHDLITRTYEGVVQRA